MESHLTCVVIFVLLFLCHFACTVRKTLWNQEPRSDDVIFTDHLLWEIQSKSRLDCAKLCTEDLRCASMTSTTLTSHSVTCRGHSQVMTSGGTPKPATKHYRKKGEKEDNPTYYLGSGWLRKPCQADSNCSQADTECFKQRCLCTPGYYYSSSQDSCQSSCDALQPHLVEYPGWFLGLNNMNESLITQERCREWCLSLDNCLSMEYHYGMGKCYIASVTVLQVPDSWKEAASNLSYFQRTCS